jgi:hypothetical protein
MAASAEQQHEDRTRVVCHVPLNNPQEEKAFKEIVEYLQAQRRKRIGVDGFTYSAPMILPLAHENKLVQIEQNPGESAQPARVAVEILQRAFHLRG